jgi:hypothetical protein
MTASDPHFKPQERRHSDIRVMFSDVAITERYSCGSVERGLMRTLKRARVAAAALGVVAGTLVASAGPGTSVSQAAAPADGATTAASRT